MHLIFHTTLKVLFMFSFILIESILSEDIDENQASILSIDNLKEGKYNDANKKLKEYYYKNALWKNQGVGENLHSNDFVFSLNNLAVSHYMMGEYESAMHFFLESLNLKGVTLQEFLTRTFGKHEVDALKNLQWMYQTQNKVEMCLLIREKLMETVCDAFSPLPESLLSVSFFDIELGQQICTDPLMANSIKQYGRPVHVDLAKLYLDQVKRGLTYFLNGDIPHHFIPTVEWDINYRMRDKQYGMGPEDGSFFEPGATVKEVGNLNMVQFAAEDVLKNKVEGDFLEAGVWRGGTSILLKAILRAYKDTDRKVIMADSFQGIPDTMLTDWDQRYASPYGTVEDNFVRFGLDDKQVFALEGFFDNSLPQISEIFPGLKLSLLLADADAYGSTVDILVNLYPLLEVGGYLIVDDFHIAECRQAILEYRAMRNITEPMLPCPIDYVFTCKRKSNGTPFTETTLETTMHPHAMYMKRQKPEDLLLGKDLKASDFHGVKTDFDGGIETVF